ncbi:VWA containing CoxE family protein [Pseudomonas aeruginosa]|nr:VWA containing CoxE family protein [Pseudomonas aeruginosa]
MLLNLFNEMRAAKVPVSVRELLDLIDALKHRVVFADMDEFYYLARTIMVKDERHFDKFDRALRRPTSRAWRSSTTTSRR